MNKVELVGRLARDFEIRDTEKSIVARASLAVNRYPEGADFINIVAFGTRAETLEKYVHKGDLFGLVGHIQTGSYEKDGVNHYTFDIIIDEFDFLNPSKKELEDTKPTGYQKKKYR